MCVKPNVRTMPSLLSRRSALRGCEEDEEFEFFGDLEKPMLYLRPHEDNRTRLHGAVFLAHSDSCVAVDDIVDFVFRVRQLRIPRAFGQHIDGIRRNSRYASPLRDRSLSISASSNASMKTPRRATERAIKEIPSASTETRTIKYEGPLCEYVT